MNEFSALFEGVSDPRRSNATRHDLHEMLMIALLCVLCGGECCHDMSLFGRTKERFLRQFMRLEHGIPSHDAFSDLFNALDPGSFQQVMGRLLGDFAANLSGVIAIDGKALRRSFCKASGASPLHLVQAFAAEARLVLGQARVDEKSNEITALPALLALLDLKGTTITADALHTQRATSEAICAKKGDYVLALKANQGRLYEDVKLYLDDPETAGNIQSFQTVDGDHGRIETRSASLCHDIDWLQEHHAWPGLAAIGKVTGTREIAGKTTTKTRYFLLSSALAPERFAEIVRLHWRIENSLHWVLDVTMNEDQARNRKGHGPENLAMLRRTALNLARTEPTKGSMRGKIKKAGWSDDFMLDMIREAMTV
ncbi:MAG: ISAs1 family transposase [Alphaproteobacteria bacterium]|nr:ISAs1 family transposase [Alphaproteobacteria bacterium]